MVSLNEKAEREVKRTLANEVKDRKTKEIVKISKEQLQTLTDFYNYYSKKPTRHGTVKVRTLALILKQIRKIGIFTKKPYEDVTQKDLTDFMESLEGTNNCLKLNLAIFFKWLKKKEILYDDNDELINCMKQIRTESTRTPQSILTKEEIKQMVDSCDDFRTKALIMLTYEGGLRASEITSLNVKDVEFDEHGAKVWVRESKTKKRFVRIIDTSPFLAQYMQSRRAEPDEPLFISFSRKYGPVMMKKRPRLNAQAVTSIIKRAAVRAGINKKVFAHLLRHSAVTNLHKQGMDTILSAKRHGISRRTLEEVYLHSSDVDAENAYLKAKGVKKSDDELVKEKEEREKLAPKKCEHCGTINAFDVHYCKECKRPVDLKTFVEADEKKEEEIKKLVKDYIGFDPGDIKRMKELLQNES